MIRMRCQCGKDLKISNEHVGRLATCPRCSAKTRVIGQCSHGDDVILKARFIIICGPSRGGEQLFPCGHAEIFVGNSESVHLRLEGTSVPQIHCRLVFGSYGWRAEAADQAYPLMINDRRVKGRNLLDGDVLEVGDYGLQYFSEPPCRKPATKSVEATSLPPAPNSEQNLRFIDAPADSSVPPPLSVPVGSPGASASSVGPDDDDDDPFLKLREDDDLDAGVAVTMPAEDGDTRFDDGHAEQSDGPQCPCCGRYLPRLGKICVQCGINVKTGKAIVTAQETGLDDAYTTAETTISLISWIIGFGVYPIASEAFGGKKPYVIRAIAVITILVSVWFLIIEVGCSPSMQRHKNLMLWTGNGQHEAGQLEQLYERRNWGDRGAFAAAKDEAAEAGLEGKALVLAAHNRLDDEQRCTGTYETHQLITHAFLHVGIMHLAGNLLFLMILGSRVNALIGNIKTVVIYPILAIGGGIAQMLAVTNEPPVPCIGASGAVMGLAGMYIVLFPVHKMHMAAWCRLGLLFMFQLHLKLFSVRGFWIILFYISFDVFYTSLQIETGTAHWAHLGGFAVGVLVALLLLFTRLINARGADILSVTLGRWAWPLVGRPRRS